MPCEIAASPAVKDLIERMGVPHTEVDLILVNGQSVGLAHPVETGDRVSVFPVFESLDISPIQHVRPAPLRRTAFVLDVHLGRLARYLRMLGFDCLYDHDLDDAELARLSSKGRILLTRDRGLLKRRTVTHGYLVRDRYPLCQAAEVVRRFDLSDQIQPFTRCLACNEFLKAIPPEEVPASVPARVRSHHRGFARCTGCGSVFWRGSHYRAMVAMIRTITETAMSVPPLLE